MNTKSREVPIVSMCRTKNASAVSNTLQQNRVRPIVPILKLKPKSILKPKTKVVPKQSLIVPIDIQISRTLMEWLIQVFHSIELEDIKYIDNRIIFLAKNLLLKYNERKMSNCVVNNREQSSIPFIQKSNAQLIGACALILAYKYELDNDHMPSDLISTIMEMSDGAYNLEQYLAVERDMFITLTNNGTRDTPSLFSMRIEYDIMIEKIYTILGSEEQYTNPLSLSNSKSCHKNLLYTLSVYFLEKLIYYTNEKISEENIDACIIISIYIIQKLDIYNLVSRIFNIKNKAKHKGLIKVYEILHNFSLPENTNKKVLNCVKNYIDNYDKMNSRVIDLHYHDKITKMLCKHFVNADTFPELFQWGKIALKLKN